jgi:hypothetical protein
VTRLASAALRWYAGAPAGYAALGQTAIVSIVRVS